MPPAAPVRAFLSYAHEDHAWRDAVLKHIGWLSHTHQLDAFDDRALKPGELWDARIGRELERADIVIALISPDFVFSRYCSVDELLRAIERQRDGSADLVPIVCDHVDLGALPLAAHQCLPQDERNDLKPLVDWPNPNLPLARCAAKIRGLVEARRPPPAAEPEPAPPPPTPPVTAAPGLAARLTVWAAAKLAGLVGPMLTTIHLPLPAPAAPTPEPPAPADPPPPGRLIGRQTDLDQLTSWILDDSRQPIAVLGPGGIGKSRLTIAALHDRRVTTRFGDRHHFVSLEEARDGPGVFAAVAAALGLAADSRPQAAVLAALPASPTLLVLDNAETPWEADRPGAEQAFAVLARLPTVRLVASLRGFELPGLADWRPLILEPLPEEAAATLFTRIAGPAFAADPDLSALLARLDGLPLAIELVAHRARTEPDAATVLRQWDAERSAFLRRGQGGRKDLDLAVSLALSLASPRMAEPARRLFAALGRLPHGLARADLPAIMPEGGDEAATSLTQMALVRRDPDRLRMLAPIREFAAELPLAEPDAAALVNHFGALADVLPYAGTSSYDATAALRARVEIANIEAILPQTASGDVASALGRRWVRIGDTRQMLGSVTMSLAALTYARACFAAAAAIDPMNRGRQHDLSVSWERLGDVLQAQGDLQAALHTYTESQTICSELVAADPDNARWEHGLAVSWNKLGSVRQAQGNLQAALDAYRKAHDILAKLVQADAGNAGWQRDLGVSWNKLGDVRHAQGDLQAALQAYTESRTIRAKLAGADPGNAEWQRDLAISWNKLGDIRQALGDLQAALDAYAQDMEITAKLTAADPSNAGWQRDLAISYGKFGGVRHAKGDLQAALQAYTKGMEITAKLAAADPGNARWQRDLSVSWNDVGDVYQAQGDLKTAFNAYTESQTIRANLAAADPVNAGWQRDLAVSWEKLGGVCEAQGDLKVAFDAYTKSETIRAKLAAADPLNAQWQRDLIVSYVKLAEVSAPDQQPAAAATYYRQAVDVARMLAATGRLAPVDAWMVEDLERRLAAAEATSAPPP